MYIYVYCTTRMHDVHIYDDDDDDDDMMMIMMMMMMI